MKKLIVLIFSLMLVALVLPATAQNQNLVPPGSKVFVTPSSAGFQSVPVRYVNPQFIPSPYYYGYGYGYGFNGFNQGFQNAPVQQCNQPRYNFRGQPCTYPTRNFPIRR